MSRRMPCRARLARDTPITCGAPNGWCRLFISVATPLPGGAGLLDPRSHGRRTAPWLQRERTAQVQLMHSKPLMMRRTEIDSDNRLFYNGPFPWENRFGF